MELFKKIDIDVKENDTLRRIKNIFLLVYVILETLYKTIFGMYFAAGMDRLQCVVAIGLIGLLAVEFFRLDKENKIKWLKKNIFVIGYFVVRLITLIHIGMEYTMMRSIIFEVVYLLVLTELIVDSLFAKKIILKGFILTNLILNIINVIVFCFVMPVVKNGTYVDNNIFWYLWENTYVKDFMYFCNSSMYSNPNQFGLMTVFAAIIALNYFSKELTSKYKIMGILYFAFSVFCLVFSKCSSALVGLIVVVVAYFIVQKMNWLTPKHMIVALMTIFIVVSFSVFGFVSLCNENEEYKRIEDTIDSLSTHRYTIWKDCYFSHREEWLLGCGNITLEKRDRYQYNLDKGNDLGLDINGSLIDYVGPHNGYIGMLACTGIMGSIMLLLVFIKKIIDSKVINRKYWYLAVIFILVINLFECMIPVSKNFCCLYFFLILTLNNDEDKYEFEKNTSMEVTK